MAGRIAFRGRARGCVVAEDVGSIQAFSICEPRVKYLKGWLTGGTDPLDGSVECGDGTEYPMHVTPAQLEEIMYRVRDSKWVSGETIFFKRVQFLNPPPDDYDFRTEVKITMSGASPPAQNVQTLNTGDSNMAFTIRSYAALVGLQNSDGEGPMPHATPGALGEVYVVGEFYNYEESVAAGNPYQYSYFNGKSAARDGESELCMWQMAYPLLEATVGSLQVERNYEDSHPPRYTTYDLATFRTGFSLTSYSAGDVGTIYCALSELVSITGDYFQYEKIGEVSLDFGGQVAFVDNDGTGDPFSPGNQLYLQCFFIANAYNSGGAVISTLAIKWFARPPQYTTIVDTGKVVKLILSGGDFVTAKLYSEDYYDDNAGGGVIESGGIASGTDWVFEATEWWPYKTTAGAAAWDTATGLPANGGPGA